MDSANQLGMMTYPSNPDDWCELTLFPVEGGWQLVDPIEAQLSLDPFASVGVNSVMVLNKPDYYAVFFRFILNDGREFDGTKNQVQLKFLMALESGRWKGEARVYLYDVAGKYAYMSLTPNVNSLFQQLTINLGAGQGWIEQPNFDWRFLKTIEFHNYAAFNWLVGMYEQGRVWIDELHFSYYELVLARLSVLSQVNGQAVSGVRFRLNGTYFETPQYNLGIMPSTDYTIGIDSTHFKQWEDGNPSPIRTINLAEGQNLTVTAIYSEAPAPPPPSLNLGLILLGLVAVGTILTIVIYPKLTTK